MEEYMQSQLSDDFYLIDFKRLCKNEPIAQVRIRYIGLSHIQEGASMKAVSQMVRVSVRAVANWIRRFNEGGVEALENQPGRGAKRKLSEDEEDKFRNMIIKKQEQLNGGRLRGADIHKILEEEFEIKCAISTTYDILKRANMSWITSRSRHPKQDPEVQELFKKTSKVP
jgi:transposase